MNPKRWIILLVFVIILGCTGSVFLAWPKLNRRLDGPVITVEAVYPGANAQVVADTIAAPIEQQVNGVENMVSMVSRSGNDGSYKLQVTFSRNADPNIALTLVQNRTSLAVPILPPLVQRRGISVLKKSPDVLLFVLLFSPNDRYDTLYLGNYATIHLKDELARVPGVGDIRVIGSSDFEMRIWLDRVKLADRKLTVADVTNALRDQNISVGVKGEELFVQAPGRLTDAEEMEKIVVKTGDRGEVVRLSDVARVELGAKAAQQPVLLDGRPAIALAVYPLTQVRLREASAEVRKKMEDLRVNFPEGLDYAIAFDFSTNRELRLAQKPEYLRVDLELLAGASAERTAKVAEKCDKLLRETPGVQQVLVLSGSPFVVGDHQATLLVSVHNTGKARPEMISSIREQLNKELPEAAVRLCDLTDSGRFPQHSYPLHLVIYDAGDAGQAALQNCANQVAERLRQSGKVTDVAVSAGATSAPQIYLDIDRTKAKALEVDVTEIFNALQVYLGSSFVNDFNRFGRTLQVQSDPKFPGRAEDLKQMKIRNSAGKMVPLVSIVTIRDNIGPLAVERFNMYPSVSVTANPAAGVSLTEARKVCETQANEVLPKGFRYSWLEP